VRFVDEAVVTVRSGNGGRGCTSFRRERFIPRGGPDGGDGGDGGSVILKVDDAKRTLHDYQRLRLLEAGNGKPGLGKQKHGKNGSDCILGLPPGTIVSNADNDELIVDLTESGQDYIIAQGGRGGRGNKRFATSTNRAPRYSQPGIPGTELRLKLELKILADVGLIGLPNAGKSTLISCISSAKPKIADYPFTTLSPVLGMVSPPFGEPFAVADIPGLIEGAHEGIGLGINFLKHIERTGILVHIIDISTVDPDDPLKSFHIINKELSGYNPQLAAKKQIIVLNKIDLADAGEKIFAFTQLLPDHQVLTISAATGAGTKELVALLAAELNSAEQNKE
jgi:GTPase